MIIREIIWLEPIIEKVERKHHVTQDEVEEVLSNRPRFFWMEKGKFKGEDVYVAMGRNFAGRYLTVFFIYKRNRDIIILSARAMTKAERKRYEKK